MKTKLFFTALLICALSACTMEELESNYGEINLDNIEISEQIYSEEFTDTIVNRTGGTIKPPED